MIHAQASDAACRHAASFVLMLRLFFQEVEAMDTIRPYAPKRRRRNLTRLITSINQAPRQAHRISQPSSFRRHEKTTKTYGPEGPWIWSLAGPKKFRDSGTVFSYLRLSLPTTLPTSSQSSRAQQLSRMRGVGAHEGLGRDGAQTPPFYSAHGFSSTSFTSNFAEGRPLTPGSPILPTSPFLRVTRDVLRGCAGEQRPQRGYADAVIHAPRLFASALSPSRPDTAH